MAKLTKGQIVDTALKNQTKNVYKGASTDKTVGGVADAGLATTFGKAGNGKFDPKGYFGPWIKQNSLYQAIASNLFKDGNYEAGEEIVQGDAYKKEVGPRKVARQGLILSAHPGLEAKINAANEAQKELSEKTGKSMGLTAELQKKVAEEIENY